jgi:uncharacterized membrane protein YfcA
MITNLSIAHLTVYQWCILALAALCIGMAKTGISNLGTATVPLVAWSFGGKLSTGIMLPMLIIADGIGVWYYNRHVEWSYLRKLMPWTLVGIVLGSWIGQQVDDQWFKKIMGIIFGISVLYMFWREYRGVSKVPTQWWFAMIMGVLAGVTTMIGNLAGAATAIFFLAMQLPKENFIGTNAWFYFIVNWLKVPFQVYFWHNVNVDILLLNLYLAPAIVLGAFLGIILVKRFTERFFRRLTIGLCMVAMVLLFV